MFKNAKIYRLKEPFTLDQVQLDAQLRQHAFKPCGPLEMTAMGWTPPLGGQTLQWVHGAGACLLIAARRQERLLPAAVINEAVAEKVTDIEHNEMRDVTRRERSRLREEILIDMLPRAFTRSRRIWAYIDIEANWIVVDSPNDKVAEEVLSLLRESIGSLPIKPLVPTIAVAERFSDWVAGGEVLAGLELEDQCELRDPVDNRSVVRCRGQDLSSPEIRNHLESGKRVVALGVNWNDRVSFILDETLTLKRLRFDTELIDEALDENIEDDSARLDTEFTLLTAELRTLLSALIDTFAPPPSDDKKPKRSAR